MELMTEEKKGFKQTEIGLIPEDWEVKSIIDLAYVATGNTPKTSDQSNYGNEYLFVSPADLSEKAWISETGKMLSEKGFRNARRFPKHSVLFTCIGSTIGKTGIASEDLTSNQQINAVFPSNDLYYLYSYYILTYRAPVIKELAGNQAVPIINKTQFQDSKIPLPPTLAEQQAIASALSDADELIRSLDGFIEKKEAIKKGTMQQLLTGKKRLPGFDGEWEKIEIGELLEFKNGLNKAKEYFGQGTPIINYMDTFKNPGLKKDDIRGKVTLSKDEIRRFNVKKGDVFFTRTSEIVDEIGISSVLEEDIKDGVFSGFILRGRPKNDRLNLKFKRYCFSSDFIRKQIIGMATYTTRALTNGRQLSKVKVPLPKDDQEQEAIAQILSDMDEELQALRRKREKLVRVKEGMMQELLTGRVRLV